MKLLLVTPPFVNLSSPYPAVLYLSRYLRTKGSTVSTVDIGLETTLNLFSRSGMERLLSVVNHQVTVAPTELLRRFIESGPGVLDVVDTAIACLQSRDAAAALRGARPGYFPRLRSDHAGRAIDLASATDAAQTWIGELTPAQRQEIWRSSDLDWHRFGAQGRVDRARYAASRFLDDLATVVSELVPGFSLQSYGERLLPDQVTFDAMQTRLESEPTVVDDVIDQCVREVMAAERPDVVGITIPFMGTLYGAMRIAREVKRCSGVPVVLGGGLVNTAMRALTDTNVFRYVDFVALDDGERPLELLMDALASGRSGPLLRTFRLAEGHVEYVAGDDSGGGAIDGAGDYADVDLQRYLHYVPRAASSDPSVGGLWPKMTMAHGCYWKKCTFCDVHLDYIGRYVPMSVDRVMENVKATIRDSGVSGIHFVDEALPPALMRRFAEAVLEESLVVSWWGNVRFDAALTSMASLLAQAGCVRLTGGLETASERLLQVVDKGVTLRQAAQVTKALSDAGISVHAYLIYGYPTQTVQETIDSLEFVRQLFRAGYVQTAYWHRFSLTEYSPIRRDPGRFGLVVPERSRNSFMNYVVPYTESGGIEHDMFTKGLNQSLAAYQQGKGLDRPIGEWFSFETPKPTFGPSHVVDLATRADSSSAVRTGR